MTSIRHTAADDLPAEPPRPVRDPGDAYLDAAREAILAVGWSRTTLTDIARRAGVSRMTLYRRWPDTRALLADLMTREWQELLTGSDSLAPDAAPDAETIATAVVAVVAELRDDPLLRRVVELDPEELLPYLLHRPGRSQEQVVAVLGALVRAGQAGGGVRAGDPELLARSLVLAAQGFLLSAGTMSAAHGDLAAYDAELHHLVRGHLAP